MTNDTATSMETLNVRETEILVGKNEHLRNQAGQLPSQKANCRCIKDPYVKIQMLKKPSTSKGMQSSHEGISDKENRTGDTVFYV